MSKKETMTMRQYAKKCGTSHQTISAAIKSGKLSAGFNVGTGQISVHIADLEWGLAFMEKNISRKMTKEEEELLKNDIEWDPFNDTEDIKQNTSSKELTRLELLYKARMAKIKVEEAVRKLVNKDDMYKEMFEFGKEIRMNIQSIPDRIIDQLITLDRNSAHKMLSESINEALEKLSEDEEGN